MNEIVKQVSIELGKPMKVKLLDNVEIKEQKINQVESLTKELDLPINIIDE